MIRFCMRSLLLVIEKLVNELALIATILTVAQQGSAHERLIGASQSIVFGIRDIAIAFYQNTAFSEVMAQARAAIDGAIDGIVKSIESDPQTALVAAIGTFFTYKLLPYFLRVARRALKRGKRSCHELENVKAGTPPPPPTVTAPPQHRDTYNQLYRDR